MRKKGVRAINMNMFRRNFKMKVRITKEYRGVKIGDELESVTMRRGTYTGLIKGTHTKISVPSYHAEVIN